MFHKLNVILPYKETV